MKFKKSILIPIALVASFAAALSLPALSPTTHTTSANPIRDLITGTRGGDLEGQAHHTELTVTDIVGSVLATVFFVTGLIAVIFIVRAGMKYTTAAGDPSKVTEAKNIIIYSVVGLIVSIAAFGIVNFIFARVTG